MGFEVSKSRRDSDAALPGRGKPENAIVHNRDSQQSRNGKMVNPIHEELRQLVAEACSYPPKHPRRRKLMNHIVRKIQQSRTLWRENVTYYEDAELQMWIYFTRNLCEATTAKAPYNPDEGSVITWLNAYLKRRLQDGKIQISKDRSIFELPQWDAETGQWLDPLERVCAPSSTPDLLERLLDWVACDPDGQLRQCARPDRPDVNAQVVLQRRLPPECITLDDLAAALNLTQGQMRHFWTKQCKPLLLEFLELEKALRGDIRRG